MARLCKACAKPLKPKNVIKGGAPTTVNACKSPICKMYGKVQ